MLLLGGDRIHDFLSAPLAGDDQIDTRALGFVDVASVRSAHVVVGDDSVFAYDSFARTAVKARINLSDLSETRYKPVRISTVKGLPAAWAKWRAFIPLRAPGTTATLVGYVNADGEMSVFHSVTDGGEDVLAAWSLWSIPNTSGRRCGRRR